MQQDPQHNSPHKDGWLATWGVLVALMGLTIGGLGAMAAHQQSSAQVAPVRIAVDSGAVKWASTHKALLGEAAGLEPPSVLPPALAEEVAPGTAPQRMAVVPKLAGDPALTSVPPEQRVVIGVSSSVIGEIDPCG